MRKSIFKYLILILFPLAITISYTSAWFSGKAVSNQNVMKSGTLILRDPGQIIAEGECEGIFPGWKYSKTIDIQNKGTLPMKCKMSIKSDENNILVSGDHGIYASLSNIEDNRYKEKQVKLGKISDAYIGIIQPGTSRDIQLDFNLPQEAGNEYSGLSSNLKFYIDAIQENAPFVYTAEDSDTLRDVLSYSQNKDIINIFAGEYNDSFESSKYLNICGSTNSQKEPAVFIKPKEDKYGLSFNGDFTSRDSEDSLKLKNIAIVGTTGINTNGINLLTREPNTYFDNIQFLNCNKGVRFSSGMYLKVTFNNCKFIGDSYPLSFGDNVVITNLYFNHCTFSGQIASFNLNGKVTNLYVNNVKKQVSDINAVLHE